ncbi:MAG TPA: FkbM family methyltransferase [Caulobacteraceae bacterium]|nr:FkbM family methyltransferase [Caulobacteraceae bacterium]
MPTRWRSAQASDHLANPDSRLAPRLYAYLDPQTALTTLHDGLLIFVGPLDEQITPRLIAQGRWESHIERAIRRLVGAGDQVIEVGANVGYYTLIISSLIGEAGRLDAFEANPRLARLLRRTISCSGRGAFVNVHEQLVADRPGVMKFYVCDRFGGAGNVWENGWGMGQGTEVIERDAVRLDDMFAGRAVDFIRTDTEGAELLILNGAMALLQRSKAVKLCVEWSVRKMSARGDVSGLVGALDSMGFRFWRIDISGLIPVDAGALLTAPDCELVIARSIE